MNTLKNAKVGDYVVTSVSQSRGGIIGADVNWCIWEIAAVSAAQIAANHGGHQIRIRKKDGLILGDGNSHRNFAQPATPEMIKEVQNATRLRRQALAAKARILAVADNLMNWRIYASGTPAINEKFSKISDDVPAVDGMTLEQAEMILAAIEDIMKPPSEIDADKISADMREIEQEQEDFLVTAFTHIDFSLPSTELAASGEPTHIDYADNTRLAIALALEEKGLVRTEANDRSVPGLRVKLTAAGANWMKIQGSERDANEEDASDNRPRAA
jgi:hypothetical protein